MNWMTVIYFLKWVGIVFPILYLGYFLIPCGLIYFWLYVRSGKRLLAHKIIPRFPQKGKVRKEIMWSTLTILVFSVGVVLTREMIIRGYTKVYFGWLEYPAWYLLVSFTVFMIIHDAYLYWIHRIMHARPLFKYVHKVHHKFLYPTPFAVFASHPVEAVLNFAIIPILLVVLPINFWLILIYFGYNLATNIAGHSGFEFLSPKVKKLPLVNISASPTTHQIHHIRFNKNYGGYFNLWDRLMGSYLPEVPEAYRKPLSRKEKAA